MDLPANQKVYSLNDAVSVLAAQIIVHTGGQPDMTLLTAMVRHMRILEEDWFYIADADLLLDVWTGSARRPWEEERQRITSTPAETQPDAEPQAPDPAPAPKPAEPFNLKRYREKRRKRKDDPS
jgi:hypothetical protein